MRLPNFIIDNIDRIIAEWKGDDRASPIVFDAQAKPILMAIAADIASAAKAASSSTEATMRAALHGAPDFILADVCEALRKLREMGYPSPTADFLVMSAVEGKLEAVKLFVEAGYSPDTKNQGSPAIVNAAMFGNPEVVEYLISVGADVNAVDDVNTTALMRIAEKCEATDTVKALLQAGAKTDIKSAGGVTALQHAEWAKCEDNVAAIKGAAKKKR